MISVRRDDKRQHRQTLTDLFFLVCVFVRTVSVLSVITLLIQCP